MAFDSDTGRRSDRWIQWCTRYWREESRDSVQQEGYSWQTVIKAFEDKGLTEEDALLNARLARILTVEDYDSKKEQPKLWTPEASYTIDDGTGLQDASY